MTKQKLFQETIKPQDFNKIINKLRGFFMQKGYLETFPQPRLSILAACEDPKTVKSYEFNGEIWPLQQTNQMHLETILLENANDIDGLYTLTASYRDEPTPLEGRHLRSFTMFEAEHKGNFEDLLKMLKEISVYLGLAKTEESIPFFTYNELCEKYNTDILEAKHEQMMWEEYGDVIGITYFPRRNSPFFNMKFAKKDEKTGEDLYYKCDLIVCGQETFGCAERSIDVEQMRESFHTISEGKYSELLFEKFGKERVEEELEEFLKLPMLSRWGFGMGFQRLYRALNLKGLI